MTRTVRPRVDDVQARYGDDHAGDVGAAKLINQKVRTSSALEQIEGPPVSATVHTVPMRVIVYCSLARRSRSPHLRRCCCAAGNPCCRIMAHFINWRTDARSQRRRWVGWTMSGGAIGLLSGAATPRVTITAGSDR